jgi:hypothetical protein
MMVLQIGVVCEPNARPEGKRLCAQQVSGDVGPPVPVDAHVTEVVVEGGFHACTHLAVKRLTG